MNRQLLLTSIVLLFTACSSKTSEDQITSVPMDTPHALVMKSVSAMKASDREAFLECFSVSQQEYEVLDAIMDTGVAYLDFKSNFVNVYGEEAWVKFQDPEQAPEGADMSFTFVTDEDVAKAKAWEPEDDILSFQFPNAQGPAFISKMESGYIFEFGEMLGKPKSKEIAQFINLMDSMTELISDYTHAIGYTGITAEDIDYQMGKDMMKNVFGFSLNTPDRFNIEEIKN
ncbi:MAG: hypothetical protein PF450_00470 [Bacteroidales bacterium]|jgi:hypothetical protein|nr:hypothetical protein [Bacteroidales bacterium]